MFYLLKKKKKPAHQNKTHKNPSSQNMEPNSAVTADGELFHHSSS